MKSLYLWPAWPFLSLLVLFASAQIFLYAARVPVHRALRALGSALGRALRSAGRFCSRTAEYLHARDRERVIAQGKFELEEKISKEFRKVEGAFSKELAHFPEVARRLDDVVARVDADYAECGVTPPDPPGWGESVAAIANVPKTGDRVVEKLLGEIHKSAVAGEKRAIVEFRDATAKRHKVLATMAPLWKEIKSLLGETGTKVAKALESARKIDGYVAQYEATKKNEDAAARTLAGSQTNLFLISALVLGVALGGAFVNFQLIRLPMSELVPSGTRIGGVPVPTIAALVIVLMEIAAGIFLTETLGLTSLFPKIELLPASKRRVILGVSFTGLLLLAGVECSLAVLREHIVEADSALKASLAGASVISGAASSKIPVIGQAVLGFVLPWILAMVAVPLETLFSAGSHAVTVGACGGLQLFGGLARLLGMLVRGLASAMRHVYDVAILIPLQLEKIVKHWILNPPPETTARTRNPALDVSSPALRVEGGRR
jgi:hypothetical protein